MTADIGTAGPETGADTDADPERPRGRDLFADRRFTALFLARTISVLGSGFGPVALAFGVLDLPDANATTLTVVLAAQAVPEVLLLLFGGVVADRFPRSRVMTGAELLSAAAFGALAAMFVTGYAPIPLVAAFAAITGIAIAMFFPALTGVVPEVVPEDRLQTANGVLRMGVNAAKVLGLAFAGGTVALVGPGWALAVNAGCFVASAVLLASLRLPAVTVRGESSMLDELREGWVEFRSRQWLWAIVLQFAFVIGALQAVLGVLGPVIAKADLGGATGWSVVLGGEAVGMFAGVFIAIRIRPRRPLLVATLMVFVPAVPLVLLGVHAPLVAIALGSVLLGAAFDVFGVLWETTMQREIPREALSRVSAYDALGSFMFGPLGLVLAAPLAEAIGPHRAVLACAAVVVVATAGALLSPDVRRLSAPGAAAARPAPEPEAAAAR
ncbi:MFS transporter [Yinghuangia seranimata]|uniref:MFS transporter n=1 Tax=Yinghuangia seranimata TaxID=408067 RepID=UPI00248AB4F1|nr:MFS transporter [Yinghuangia seranimata]MDI2126604.1 MFS transporter [Yinghuangia seranimata]